MNYNHLYYFHVTAREGSIARAAKRLNVSQPTISEQLKSLKDYLNEKLFDRTGGALRLNNSGRRALKYTERIFDMGDRLRKTFAAAPVPAKVRVEIGMISTAAHSVTTDRLVGLFRDAKTMVRIKHGDNHFLFNELVNSGLDVLITDRLPNRSDEMKHREIASTKLVIIAENDLARRLDGDLPNFLHLRPFIQYSEQSTFRWEVDRYFQKHFIEPDFVAEVDDSYLILHAVAEGIGVGCVPRSVLRDSGLSGKVTEIGEIGTNPKLYALYRSVDPTQETLKALDILAGVHDEVSLE